MGYMEVVDVEEVLREAKIEERTVFYGVEEIATGNPIWKAFYFIKIPLGSSMVVKYLQLYLALFYLSCRILSVYFSDFVW